MRVLPSVFILTMIRLRRRRNLPLPPALALQLRRINRRLSARLVRPVELPGEDIEDCFQIQLHDLCDGSPVAAVGLAEVVCVSIAHEVAQGVVVDVFEGEFFA